MPLTKLERGENWGETTEFYFWLTKYETSMNLWQCEQRTGNVDLKLNMS